jgi:hypothetical protein
MRLPATLSAAKVFAITGQLTPESPVQCQLRKRVQPPQSEITLSEAPSIQQQIVLALGSVHALSVVPHPADEYQNR